MGGFLPSVVAVICTYRRHEILDNCLKALAQQTCLPAAVYVVDNGGTWERDGKSHPFTVIKLTPSENLGPGGGFALGMQRALDDGAEYMWLMDDDIHPDPKCLEILYATASLQPQNSRYRVWPCVVDPDCTLNENPGWWGFLQPAHIVAQCGLPREDYGWWSEDTEYSFRLEKIFGVTKIRVPEAIVFHRHASRGKRSPAWRLYYETRNGIHFRWRVKKVSYWKGVRIIIWTLKKAFQPPADEGYSAIPVRVVIVLQGVWDGVFSRLGLRIKLGSKP